MLTAEFSLCNIYADRPFIMHNCLVKRCAVLSKMKMYLQRKRDAVEIKTLIVPVNEFPLRTLCTFFCLSVFVCLSEIYAPVEPAATNDFSDFKSCIRALMIINLLFLIVDKIKLTWSCLGA